MSEQQAEQCIVQVWFGSHVIAKHIADPEHAARYAAAMERRFFGLRVTNDPVCQLEPEARPLPAERLWDSIPPH